MKRQKMNKSFVLRHFAKAEFKSTTEEKERRPIGIVISADVTTDTSILYINMK